MWLTRRSRGSDTSSTSASNNAGILALLEHEGVDCSSLRMPRLSQEP